MQCKFCRGDIPEGAKVCPTCGTPVESAAQESSASNQPEAENNSYNYQQANNQSGEGQYNYQQGTGQFGEGQYNYQQDQNQQNGNQYNYQQNNGQNYNQGYNQGYDQGYNNGNVPGGKPISGTPYMIFAILCTLLCCLPLGIVGIVYAAKINSLQKVGDVAGAKEAAKKAKIFTIIGAVGGLIISIIYLALFVFAGDATSDIVDDVPAVVEDIEEPDDADEAKEEVPKVVPSGELGAAWNTYTVQINDKVITLPCEMKDLEAIGFQLDTGDTSAEYMVNPDEYELAFFNDQYGHSIMFDMINETDAALKIVDCKVGGIYIDEYDVEDGNLSVIFPGNVQIGSTKDEVLAAYGEASDVYEGDTLHSYTWYADDDYFKNCRIELDAETQKVSCMSLQCYDL